MGSSVNIISIYWMKFWILLFSCCGAAQGESPRRRKKPEAGASGRAVFRPEGQADDRKTAETVRSGAKSCCLPGQGPSICAGPLCRQLPEPWKGSDRYLPKQWKKHPYTHLRFFHHTPECGKMQSVFQERFHGAFHSKIARMRGMHSCTRTSGSSSEMRKFPSTR